MRRTSRPAVMLLAGGLTFLAACMADPPGASGGGDAVGAPQPAATPSDRTTQGPQDMRQPKGFGAMKPKGPSPDDADACGASALQGLVGQPLAAFDPSVAPGRVRIIHPGQMITMDYSAARLNVTVSGADVILRIHCG